MNGLWVNIVEEPTAVGKVGIMVGVQFLSCARVRTHYFFTSQDSRKLELTLVCTSICDTLSQLSKGKLSIQDSTPIILLHVHVDVSDADSSLLTSGIGWLNSIPIVEFCIRWEHRRVYPYRQCTSRSVRSGRPHAQLHGP